MLVLSIKVYVSSCMDLRNTGALQEAAAVNAVRMRPYVVKDKQKMKYDRKGDDCDADSSPRLSNQKH